MIDGVPIRRLFVSNIAKKTTSKDLRDYFSTYGKIEKYYLRRNQKRSNCGFVTFTNVADAAKAIQDGSRKERRLHNRYLRVIAARFLLQPDSMEQTAILKSGVHMMYLVVDPSTRTNFTNATLSRADYCSRRVSWRTVRA